MKMNKRGRISLLPRWWHRRRAQRGGLFWLPCPKCGREFGGHEWLRCSQRVGPRVSTSIIAGVWSNGCIMGWGICPDCVRRGLGEM